MPHSVVRITDATLEGVHLLRTSRPAERGRYFATAPSGQVYVVQKVLTTWKTRAFPWRVSLLGQNVAFARNLETAARQIAADDRLRSIGGR